MKKYLDKSDNLFHIENKKLAAVADFSSMRIRLFLTIVLILAVSVVHASNAFCETLETESYLVISDIHLTREAQDQATMLEAIIQVAKGKDVVLFLGDNTNNAHMEEHALMQQWASSIKQLTGAEVYIIPGNHDYSVKMRPDEFCTQYRQYGWEQSFSCDTASASYAVMTKAGVCLLLLDTNKYDNNKLVKSDGGIEGTTLIWLQKVLESLPNETPVIAIGHHPILPSERNARTPGASALSQVLRAYGIGLYLCGHDHGFSIVEQDGLQQITVGQLQNYPGWVGIIEKKADGFLWHTEQIYNPQSSIYRTLREKAYSTARIMAQGALATTPYADDEEAINWFTSAYMLLIDSEMTPEKSAVLLTDENCQKWRNAQTRTVVKEWILNLLENCPKDVRQLYISPSQKHSLEY